MEGNKEPKSIEDYMDRVQKKLIEDGLFESEEEFKNYCSKIKKI